MHPVQAKHAHFTFCLVTDVSRSLPSPHRHEKEYFFAMVAVGGSQQRSGDIADKLNVKSSALGPFRSQLTGKGMIYSPSHGDNAFTVPLFDGFSKRQLNLSGIQSTDRFGQHIQHPQDTS